MEHEIAVKPHIAASLNLHFLSSCFVCFRCEWKNLQAARSQVDLPAIHFQLAELTRLLITDALLCRY